MKATVDVSVIVPVKDGYEFLPACLQSLLDQDFQGIWEVSVYNDGSQDNTHDVINEFAPRFKEKNVGFIQTSGKVPGGVGFAKNQAVMASSGRFLCFCDADDVCLPSRIRLQFETAVTLIEKTDNQSVFLGSRFERDPDNSTSRYTRWANQLSSTELYSQIYTSHGPTLIAPTWFISRSLYDSLQGFKEIRNGYPEDLDFFFRSFTYNPVLFKVEAPLVIYRYHSRCASFGVSEHTIWNMRLNLLKQNVLSRWSSFTIWNAGKQGKSFFKCLDQSEQEKVVQFCDVDERKIRHGWYEPYDEITRRVTKKIPIVHVRDASPPFIVCVKLDMTGGDLERSIADSGWKEGEHYILFS